jgi:hypothetical protein
MSYALLSEFRKLSPSSPLVDELKAERALRFLLLYIRDQDADCSDLVDALSTAYTNYLTQFPKFSRRSQVSREFSHLLKALRGTDDPAPSGDAPFPEGFEDLRQELTRSPIPSSLARSLAHVFGATAFLTGETFALQKRLQQLQTSRSVVTSPLRKGRPAGARSVVFSPTQSPERAKPDGRAVLAQRRRELAALQSDVEQLRTQARELKNEGGNGYRAIADKRREAEELTRLLEVAVAENRRLKQLSIG